MALQPIWLQASGRNDRSVQTDTLRTLAPEQILELKFLTNNE